MRVSQIQTFEKEKKETKEKTLLVYFKKGKSM